MKRDIIAKIKNEIDDKRNRAFTMAALRLETVRKEVAGYVELENEIAKISIAATRKIISNPADAEAITIELQSKIKEISKAKTALLVKAGYSLDYLKPEFECTKCNDTGLMHGVDGDKPCNCFKQREIEYMYEESGIVKGGPAQFDKFDSGIFSDIVDEKRFLISKSPQEQIEKIREFCTDYLKNNLEMTGSKGLLFFGTTGTGKTFMAQCIANEAILQGKTVVYVSAPQMFDKLNEARMTFGEEAHEDYFAGLRDAELLIIDDLGTETMTEAKSSNLLQILNTRTSLDLSSPHKTLISTNLNLRGIRERYDDRIYSRIIGSSFILQFGGEDLRMLRK